MATLRRRPDTGRIEIDLGASESPTRKRARVSIPDELVRLAEAAMALTDDGLVDTIAQAVALRLEAGLLDRRPRLVKHLSEWQEVTGREWAEQTRRGRRTICASLTETLGRYRVDEVRQREWDEYVAAHPNLSRSTLRLHLATLRSALGQAVAWEHMVAVPRIRYAQPAKDEVRWLTREEEARLLAACTAPDLAIALRLALWAGLRLGEVLGLRWEDVDLGRAAIHVRQQRLRFPVEGVRVGPPKGKRPRRVPAPPPLVAALKEHRALCVGPATVVRGKAGRIWSHAGADQALRSLGLELEAQRQGIAGLRWHVTRHTYAARVLQDGKQIFDLSVLLGHASVMTTQKYYAHLAPDQLADAVRSVGRAEGGEG